jgi:hypothetical protein
MDLRRIGWDGVDWMKLTQDKIAGNILSGCTIVSFSGRALLRK